MTDASCRGSIHDAAANLVVVDQDLRELRLDQPWRDCVDSDPGGAELLPWIYIAAFPSLHVSQVLIIAWYFRYSRSGLLITGLFAFLSTVSTVLLGWHYVVDWFGGIAVAALAIWMAIP